MSLINKSPFKAKELDVTLPTMGKVKAFAHAKNSVVMKDAELPGFSELHLPVDVLLGEPDIENKIDFILYMLNETDNPPPYSEFKADFDDGDLEFKINSKTNSVELQDLPLFQVITREKLFLGGMYEIHEDAIITQDEQLAHKMREQMGSLNMVFPVGKKPNELYLEERARVINNPKAGMTIAKIRDALDRYDVKSFSFSKDSAELVSQSLKNVDPFDKKLINNYFEKRGDVSLAIYNLIVDQRFNPTPVPVYDRVKNENGLPDLYTAIKNKVSKTDVDNEYIIDIPNDGPMRVSKDEPSKKEKENGITMVKNKM